MGKLRAKRVVRGGITSVKKQMFILEVNDTQDHSWQGQLKWIQGDSKQSFRSVIELLRLIDSAVSEEEAASAESVASGQGDLPAEWEGASPGEAIDPDAKAAAEPDD